LLEIEIVNWDLVSESATIMIFKVSILLDGLSSLMICTYDLTVLTKTEEMIHYYESFGYGGKGVLNKTKQTIRYRSNGVSVPAEDG
jgi:hypothetical protein